MKNFKLLNNTISFDEDLLKCSKIYLKKSECLDKYSSHYDKEKQDKINNIEELINFFKNKENIKNVEKLKDIKGINKSQLSRIIRIDRKNISKYWS